MNPFRHSREGGNLITQDPRLHGGDVIQWNSMTQSRDVAPYAVICLLADEVRRMCPGPLLAIRGNSAPPWIWEKPKLVSWNVALGPCI